MKYVIWGAGIRGTRLFAHLGEENVIAFVDKNINMETYCGKLVIDIEEYINNYNEFFIIISFVHEQEGINILKQYGCENYLLLSDCPGEFQESNVRNILKQYVCSQLDANKRYAVIGENLYSFLVYDWINENCNVKPVLFLNEEINPSVTRILASNDYQYIVTDTPDLESYNETMVCQYYTRKEIKQIYNKWNNAKYIYDCSSMISEYYNPRIEMMKNRYKGHRCFIVATGPSLRMSDLDKLHEQEEISISMNDIWRAFSDTKWRPQFYIADDYGVMEENGDELEKMEVPNIILGDTSSSYWKEKHKDNIMKHHFSWEYSETRLPEFSDDFSRMCYMGSTVTYSCMQFAVYLGFSEIYLLGVDFSYAGSKDAKYEHFFKEEKLVATGFTAQVSLAYKAARKYADAHGIKIYNATRGGKLEVFERVDFDSLF